jgi:hypothetical protein
MKDVLDAVDDRRLLGAFQDVHDAFESQEIGAAMLGKRLEKERQRHRPDRLSAQDRIGIDVVPAMRMSMCDGTCSQPRLDIERLSERIVEASVE